ncbi:MAG: hypothetical protein JWO51_4368 [Rhodospirillales bacterium]|nr:hypothetical protein [Rhodospirillales bacterium]
MVMAGLDPAIHVVGQADFMAKQGSGGGGVDARVKPGHDGVLG